MSAAVGIIAGTALGRALSERLKKDGSAVHAVAPEEDFAPLTPLRLIVVDAEPEQLPALAEKLGNVTDGNHLIAHRVRGLLPGGESPYTVLRAQTPVLRLGVLAGPLSASDLSAGLPTAAVVASRHPEVVSEFAAALSTPRLRVYRSRDPRGVELAAACVDVAAVAAGVLTGLGLSAASRALLLTRIVRELERLLVAHGGSGHTASGLAGLGDIIARMEDGDAARFGAAVAKGTAPSSEVAAALRGKTSALNELTARLGVKLAIFEGLGKLVAGEIDTGRLIEGLMRLPVLDD